MSESAWPVPSPAAEQGERYVRESPIGRGSCGVVYRANDTLIGRTIALKVIRFDASYSPAEQKEQAARAHREARAAGTLSHPNIVTVFDAGRFGDEGEFFIVMEFVEGEDLRSRLSGGPVPAQDVALMGCQIARGLHFAHGLGIVHRDVKPGNILIRPDGLAKITDFGIARVDASDLTQTGQWIGSPAYMSPEQALGKPAGPLSDIFALGVVLYESLTGERPFRGESVAALGYQIVNAQPALPSKLVRGLPRKWDEVLGRAMAKKPEERHPNAEDLARELERLAARTDSRITGPIKMKQSGERLRPEEAEGSGSARTLIVVDGEKCEEHAGDMSASRIQAQKTGRNRAFIAAGLTILVATVLSGIAWFGSPPDLFEPPLSIEVVHGLESGDVEVKIDGRVVWAEAVEAIRDLNKIRPFKRASGYFPPNRAGIGLDVRPGARDVTVQVSSPEGSWFETVQHEFVAGKDEHLIIYVKTGPTKGMLLEWE